MDKKGVPMAIHVDNPEANALIHEFAAMEGVPVETAIVIAVREALSRRAGRGDPRETAQRLRLKYGVQMSERTRLPLPKDAYDLMWENG